MGKAMLVGGVFAIVLVAVVGVGGYFYLQSTDGNAASSSGERVVLVFESPAEDGATVAALISIVGDGTMKDASPDTTVAIPGTASNRLGDAFVFGGGGGVAKALAGAAGGSATAFVAVPTAVWRAAVDAQGGVSINVPQKLTVFDGTQLITILPGFQRLSAAQVSALLNAESYLTATQAAALRGELAAQMAAALVASKPSTAKPTAVLESDLSPEALSAWLNTQLAQAAGAQ